MISLKIKYNLGEEEKCLSKRGNLAISEVLFLLLMPDVVYETEKLLNAKSL